MSRTCNYSGIPTVYKEVEVEVGLDEFDENDIVKYMEDQGYVITRTPEEVFRLNALADAKRYHPETFDELFAKFIYEYTGRTIE